MGVDRTDTNTVSNGVTYDRTHYHCSNDDWWVTVESPQESA